MNRRTFLKIAGIGSIAVAAGCTTEPEKTFYTLVHAPDDMVPGEATWYASTCRECPAGCGVLAKNREGRVIKLEGNPHHPINRGALCMRGQAALQGIYDPDRLKTPMIQENGAWKPISFEAAEAMIAEKALEAGRQGPNRVRMLSEIIGDSLLALFQEALRQWGSDGPVLFEPYAYESLKAAHEAVFGMPAVPTLHMDRADLLIGFGADFLETWVSPVEYARKFKAMHGLQNGKKGLFIQVSPFQSLTAANADRWLVCLPGGEAAVIYGLIRELLARGRGQGLPASIRDRMAQACQRFTLPEVVRLSEIREADFQMLVSRLLDAKAPLVLGTGIGAGGEGSLQTDFAAVLLNLVLDPQLGLHDFENRHRIEHAARRSEVLAFLDGLEKMPAGMLLLHNTNPVFTLPPASRAAEIISRKELFVVSFTNFMDETAMLSDLVFPIQLAAGNLGCLRGQNRCDRHPAAGDGQTDAGARNRGCAAALRLCRKAAGPGLQDLCRRPPECPKSHRKLLRIGSLLFRPAAFSKRRRLHRFPGCLPMPCPRHCCPATFGRPLFCQKMK